MLGWLALPMCPRHGLDLVLLLDPVLAFTFPPLWATQFLVVSPPTPPLAVWLPVFAVGLKLEGLWAGWSKPVSILGGHMAGLPPSGLFRASLPHHLQHPNVLSEPCVVFLD